MLAGIWWRLGCPPGACPSPPTHACPPTHLVRRAERPGRVLGRIVPREQPCDGHAGAMHTNFQGLLSILLRLRAGGPWEVGGAGE